jgi:hypothetical protein
LRQGLVPQEEIEVTVEGYRATLAAPCGPTGRDDSNYESEESQRELFADAFRHTCNSAD